jgi:hypothetical protein
MYIQSYFSSDYVLLIFALSLIWSFYKFTRGIEESDYSCNRFMVYKEISVYKLSLCLNQCNVPGLEHWDYSVMLVPIW